VKAKNFFKKKELNKPHKQKEYISSIIAQNRSLDQLYSLFFKDVMVRSLREPEQFGQGF